MHKTKTRIDSEANLSNGWAIFSRLLLGAAIIVCSCSSDKGPATDPPPVATTVSESPQEDLSSLPYTPTFEPDYNHLSAQPWVEPATQAQSDDGDVFADRLEFPASHTEVLSWQPGRIVVSAPGKGAGKNGLGFARRVTSVAMSGTKIVVKTTAPALEDILQGDFQMVLDPNKGTDVDLTKIDQQWAADNLYANNPDVDNMPGEQLTDDYPFDIMPMSLFGKIKSAVTKAVKVVTSVAKAVAMAAKDTYLAITPDTLNVSGSISPEIKFEKQDDLLALKKFKKTFTTKSGDNVELTMSAQASYNASVLVNPGVQVGASIGVPGHGTSSQAWLNMDARAQAKVAADFQLAANLSSVNGNDPSKLEAYLNGRADKGQEVYNSLRQKLLGDPDTKPEGTWKKTLWLSKPKAQTLFAGPVPVVLTETIQVDMECAFEAKASITGHFEWSQNATFKFKATYDSKTNQATLSDPIFDKRHVHDLSVLGAGEAMITCGLIPRVNVFLYDSIGVFAGLRGSLVAKGSYATSCPSQPTTYWPTASVDLSLAANVGVQVGGRLQAPGSSLAGKSGQKAGFDVGPLEPWNKEFPLVTKHYDFQRGLGFCYSTCINKTRDNDETDVDCGGQCAPCQVGKQCAVNRDCANSSCNGGTCSTSTCGNKVQDGNETDIDCGGPTCGKCAATASCEVNSDCASGFCGGKAAMSPGVCLTDHCTDAVKDADEDGIDCAGNSCPKCAVGVVVGSAASCVTGLWDGHACTVSTCVDGVKSGSETDRDCGGMTCPARCGLQQGCLASSDCGQGLACLGTLQVCKRVASASCTADGDCLSGMCLAGACAAPQPSCQGVKQASPSAKDGAYTLFVGGDLTKSWPAYCANMASMPKEYLTLVKTTNANFSQYTAGGPSPGTDVRTAYQKVRLDPATLVIDPNDQTYSTSTGMLNHGGVATVQSMPYGVAMDCINFGSATGVANIDLTGTPFAVAAAQFTTGGSTPGGQTTYGASNRTVDLTGGGGCGWDAVSGASNPFNQGGPALQLQYLQ